MAGERVASRGIARIPGAEGMRRWSLLRSVIVGAVAFLIGGGIAATLLITTARSLGDAQRRQTQQLDPAQDASSVLLTDFLDQETGVRAYVLDAQADFLQPYQQAAADIPRTTSRLQAFAGGRAAILQPLGAVTAAYTDWSTTFATPQLELVRSGHLAQAQAVEESGAGKARFDLIRSRVTTLQTAVRDARRTNESRISTMQSRLETLLVAVLVAMLVAIALSVLITIRRVVLPLRALAAAARRVAGGHLHARVPVAGPGELRGLSDDLAAMRYRLLEEINRARLAGEALRLDGPTSAALHDAMLPREDEHPELVVVGRLDPAEGVLAGDWYDVIRVGDTLAVVVGDVSGHGPASAVLALGLRSIIATRLQGGGSPGDALAAAAASISRGLAEQFATVFVAVIEPAKEELRYASAGHPSALLARGPGRSEELGPTGPLVSPIVAQWSWSTLTRPFAPGDRLLAYTDGVTEGRNATKEEFGLERLKAELTTASAGRPADMVDAIADHVDAFVGASQSDDRTLVYCLNATSLAAV